MFRCLVMSGVSGLSLILAIGVQAQDASPDRATTLRVVTWNLLNLFDNVDEPDKPDEGTDPKSVAELQVLARAIDALDADVLGVQEVENRRILEALNRHLVRPYVFVELIEGNDERGIDVGLLSRIPLVSAASHRHRALDGDLRFARDFPLFRVSPLAGREIEIGVVHLKSKRGAKAESDGWRRAEAAGIRQIIEARRELEPRVPIIVMGDFNDTREADTLAPLFSFLEDRTTLVPESSRYTFRHQDAGEQIDFLLSTADLTARHAAIPHPSDNPSDHFPVIVDFALDAPIHRFESPPGEPWTETGVTPRLDATARGELERHLLQEVEVIGRVEKIHRPSQGRSASLNLHADYKKALVVYVPEEAFDRLPDLDGLVGKRIQIRGPVCRRDDVYQIRLTRAEQLTVR